MTRLMDLFRSLPRAARWGVFALGALLAYFAVVEPVVDRTNSWATTADARADAIAEVRSGPGEDDAVTLGLKQYGNVLPPGDPRERGVAFHTKVLAVIEKHGVRNHTSTTRNAPLTRGALLTALAPTKQRVDRVIREIKFEATPETLAAVIADLERTPEVAAVTKVQVRKGEGGRMVQATVDAEAWVLAKENAGR